MTTSTSWFKELTVTTKSFQHKYPGATKCFVNGDKKIWFPHNILAVHSETFEKMFSHGFAEKDQTEIDLPEDEFEGMEHVLRFWVPVPTKVVPLSARNVEFVFPVAQKYLMVQVLEECQPIIEKLINSNDFEMALKLFCVGVKCCFSTLINLCLPLCIWRKDLLVQLDSANLQIPIRLKNYIEKCAKYDGFKWNINWLAVYLHKLAVKRRQLGRTLNAYCYHCGVGGDGDDVKTVCITCNRSICHNCYNTHTTRVCIQFNSKLIRRSLYDKRLDDLDCVRCNSCVKVEKQCVFCRDMVCISAACLDNHIDKCFTLYSFVTHSLKQAELEFDTIDWFKCED